MRRGVGDPGRGAGVEAPRAVSRITREPLDSGALLDSTRTDGDGAQILFLGVVRDHAEGRPVRGMRYEAYEPMAERVLQEIVEETVSGHGVTSVAAVHRIGELTLGDASVAIVVNSPHRDAAYAASRHVIEEIKRRLPVWKHEHFTDGEERWVPGTPLEPREAGS